mgnify:CR=1 FL=1
MLELKPERLASDDFQDQEISVCGKLFRADMSGALYWPSEDALIVADADRVNPLGEPAVVTVLGETRFRHSQTSPCCS